MGRSNTRRLRVLFAALTLLPVLALGWLGARTLVQDHELEEMRRRDRLELLAQRVAVDLEREIQHLEAPLGDGAGVRLDARGLSSDGAQPVLYQPVVASALPPFDPDLVRAQRLERRDRAAAIADYRRLAAAPVPAVRGAALVALGGLLRTEGHYDEALDAYRELEALGEVPVAGGLPAALVGARGRARTLESRGDTAGLRQAATDLAALLGRGAWPIDRAAFDVYRATIEEWGGAAPDIESIRTTDAGVKIANRLSASTATRPEGVWLPAVRLYLTLGRLDQAEEAASRIRLDGHPTSDIAEGIRYDVLAARADPVVARRVLGNRAKTTTAPLPERPLGVKLSVLRAWLEAGLLEEAEAEIQSLQPNDYVRVFVEGEFARRRDRTGDAIDLLRGLLPRGGMQGAVYREAEPSYQRTARSLALAHEDLGEIDVAIDVLETATAERRAFSADGASTHLWMRSLAELARLYRRADRIPEAVEIEDDLLQRLAVADRGHPLVMALQRQRQATALPAPPRDRRP